MVGIAFCKPPSRTSTSVATDANDIVQVNDFDAFEQE